MSTPTAVPAQCLSAADVLTQAGNFSVLLAAAQVGVGVGGWLVDLWRLARLPSVVCLLARCGALLACVALRTASECSPCLPHLYPPPHQAAGLGAALSDRSLRATLFAPTDRAFALLLADLDVSAEDLLARPELLQKVRLGGCGWLGGVVGWLWGCW